MKNEFLTVSHVPKQKRVVRAPSSLGAFGPPALISVQLADDEDVQWHWSHFADGRSVVTGYTIVKKESK